MNDLPERFMRHVEIQPDGCWLWTGTRTEDGHGQYRVDGRTVKAHRYAYEQATGQRLLPIVVLRHRCNNAACVNPKHLTPGFHADNVKDRDLAGHTAIGERNGRAKLTVPEVLAIELQLANGAKKAELARHYGVSSRAISLIESGENWGSVTGRSAA